jgi:hypothetical protein
MPSLTPALVGHELLPQPPCLDASFGEISPQVAYDCYVKTHPDIQGHGLQVLTDFLCEYSVFTILPVPASHNSIIRDGINVVLTVFGNIGMHS